jgi:hypothetical protein
LTTGLRLRRKLLFALLCLAIFVAGFCGYGYIRCVGYPQKFEGRWVLPRIEQWYWTGVPGWPYPAIIKYGYRNRDGDFVAHGPYCRQIWAMTYSGDLKHPDFRLETDETGYYTEGQMNGVFTKYQTYWRKPTSHEYYTQGKLVREEFFDSVPIQ